ncbi:MAG: hypothetical protein IH991_13705, partial [Planctomycetes bacterium]|nr:hypothetical protein [Planctomycetota bacterium]
RISNDKSLLSLAANRSDFGNFEINGAHVFLETRSDGSNIEDAMLPRLKKPSSGAAVAFSVSITDSQANVTEKETGRKWSITGLNASYTISADETQPVKAKGSCTVNHSPGESGRLVAEWSWQPDKAGGHGQCVIQSQNVPLTIASPILRRFFDGLECEGTLSADCRYEWKGDGSWHRIQLDNVEGRNLFVRAPNFAGGEGLRLKLLKSSGVIEVRDGHVHATQLELESDVANLTANGSVAFDQINIDTWMNALTDENYRIVGRVDLAKLAKMLPQTLRLKQGTEITSGSVALTIIGRTEGDKRRCVATLDVSNLTGEVEGKPVTWERPIHITLDASTSDAGPRIESLTCESSFLHVTGNGNSRFGKVDVEIDLGKLASSLGQFVDLTGCQLRGNATALVTWNTDAKQQIQATGSARIQNLDVRFPGLNPFRETELIAKASAAGQLDADGLSRIQKFVVKLESGTDQITAELASPINGWPVQFPVKFDCHLSGNLTTWLPRLRALFPGISFDGKGEITLDTHVAVRENSVKISHADVRLTALNLVTESLRIKEPQMQIELAGSYDFKQGICKLHPITAACTSIALRGENIEIQDSESGLRVSGNLAYRADLARITSWWEDPKSPPSEKFFGSAVGNAKLVHGDGTSSLTTSTKFKNLTLATRPDIPQSTDASTPNQQQAWQAVWKEKQLSLDGEFAFEHQPRRVHLKEVVLSSESLHITATGTIDELDTSCLANLRGTIAYDWRKLAPILEPLLGTDIQIQGTGKQAFTLHGPLLTALTSATSAPTKGALVSPKLTAQTGFSWSSIEVLGIRASAGKLEAKLESGVVRIAPFVLALSEGRLRAAPLIHLTSNTPILELEKGPLLERVRISPEMCRSRLKYIAPFLADATRAEGTFSVDIDHASLPLTDPLNGNVKAVMHIHAAKIGPGPFGQQLQQAAIKIRSLAQGRLLALRRDSSTDWLVLPSQQVQIEIRDGRVYHQGLTFLAANDVVVHTSGSVGADETLDMIAEVPIQIAALGVTSVTIPIRGTLSRPRIDRQVLKTLSRQMLRGSVEQTLENQLKRRLESLFRPMNRLEDLFRPKD